MSVNGGGTLVDLMARAQQRATADGYFSKGTTRELRQQRIAMCGPQHRRWRLAGVPGAKEICGVCHPPAPGLDVEWLSEAAA